MSEPDDFERNHQEEINAMSAMALREERNGNHEEARKIRWIVKMWEGIAAEMKRRKWLRDSENNDGIGESNAD